MDPDEVKSKLQGLAFGNVLAAAARDYKKVTLARPHPHASLLSPSSIPRLARRRYRASGLIRSESAEEIAMPASWSSWILGQVPSRGCSSSP
jgi:hypothetical protein